MPVVSAVIVKASYSTSAYTSLLASQPASLHTQTYTHTGWWQCARTCLKDTQATVANTLWARWSGTTSTKTSRYAPKKPLWRFQSTAQLSFQNGSLAETLETILFPKLVW